ncbi:hypothetical protein FGK64_09110 [Arenibacterium halophilum]|uniref:Uncharacterized protein n=1 Tax=Arenibacterium halophilum TaxID=2583821 RepID=A0ABY2X997_9RHOB|nr:hypothetical protein FGK64_09110 [Arenibacterium halophilum]
MLLQNTNYLRFAEPRSLHRLSPQWENRLTSNRELFRGACQDGNPVRCPQKSQSSPAACADGRLAGIHLSRIEYRIEFAAQIGRSFSVSVQICVS